jgi:hypothetical protein
MARLRRDALHVARELGHRSRGVTAEDRLRDGIQEAAGHGHEPLLPTDDGPARAAGRALARLHAGGLEEHRDLVALTQESLVGGLDPAPVGVSTAELHHLDAGTAGHLLAGVPAIEPLVDRDHRGQERQLGEPIPRLLGRELAPAARIDRIGAVAAGRLLDHPAPHHRQRVAMDLDLREANPIHVELVAVPVRGHGGRPVCDDTLPSVGRGLFHDAAPRADPNHQAAQPA